MVGKGYAFLIADQQGLLISNFYADQYLYHSWETAVKLAIASMSVESFLVSFSYSWDQKAKAGEHKSHLLCNKNVKHKMFTSSSKHTIPVFNRKGISSQLSSSSGHTKTSFLKDLFRYPVSEVVIQL